MDASEKIETNTYFFVTPVTFCIGDKLYDFKHISVGAIRATSIVEVFKSVLKSILMEIDGVKYLVACTAYGDKGVSGYNFFIKEVDKRSSCNVLVPMTNIRCIAMKTADLNSTALVNSTENTK